MTPGTDTCFDNMFCVGASLNDALIVIFTSHTNKIEQMIHSTLKPLYQRTRQAFSHSSGCTLGHMNGREGMCTNALNRHRNINCMLVAERCLSLSIEIIPHMAIIR